MQAYKFGELLLLLDLLRERDSQKGVDCRTSVQTRGSGFDHHGPQRLDKEFAQT